MQFKFVAVAIAAALGVASPLVASGFGAELNGARSNGVWGGEVGLGYRLSVSQFDITPAAGAFIYKGDTGDYFTSIDRNGTKHCRAGNGQFAKKEKCDGTTAKPYGRIEAGFSIPLVARVGVGARLFSGDIRPYGTVSASLAPKIAAKINGGKQYVAAGITFGF